MMNSMDELKAKKSIKKNPQLEMLEEIAQKMKEEKEQLKAE